MRVHRAGSANSGGPAEVSAGAIDNVGIVAVAGRRDYEDPGLVRVFARVANAGSVGLPYEGDSDARWMWIDDGVPGRRLTR